MRRFSVILIALLLTTGCTIFNSSEQSAEEAVASEPSAMETEEQMEGAAAAEAFDTEAKEEEPAGARMFSEEGLDANPRMEELKKTADPEHGTPGSTDWRASEMAVPENLSRAHAEGPTNPGTLISELSRELRFNDALGVDVWEQTLRVYQAGEADTAHGVILRWGVKDDSLAGMDVRATMKADGDNWYVEELEERFHCRRGVDGERCL